MDTTQTAQQITALEQQLVDAIKNSDLAMLDQLLHDDLLFVLPNGETITKQIDLDTYKSGNLRIHTLESTIDAVSVIGDTGVVTLTNELGGAFMGNPFGGTFKYVRVWKRFDGNWRVIAGSGMERSA